jgi:NAD-dependent deacetylase
MIKQLYDIWTTNKNAKKIMVLTGPGMSNPWQNYSNEVNELNNFSKFADKNIMNIDMLLNNPSLLWDCVIEQRRKIVQYMPNANHYALVKLEQHFKENFSLITENIDNYHSYAGNVRLIEMQGNIFKDKIMLDKEMGFLNIDWTTIPTNNEGSFLRPDIVLGGEVVHKKCYLQAHMLAQQCDICLILGSALETDPFSELPMIAKKFNNAQIIEINAERSYMEDSDLYINMPVEKILPLLSHMMIDLEKGSRKLWSN